MTILTLPDDKVAQHALRSIREAFAVAHRQVQESNSESLIQSLSWMTSYDSLIARRLEDWRYLGMPGPDTWSVLHNAASMASNQMAAGGLDNAVFSAALAELSSLIARQTEGEIRGNHGERD